MTAIFVTAIYDLYSDAEFKSSPETLGWSKSWLSIEFRLKHLENLLSCDVDMIVFVQPELASLIRYQSTKVRLVPFGLDRLTTYNKVMSQTDLILPYYRNVVKDKQEYFALMNSKTDFMCMAMEHCPDFDHYIWIDGSIFKLFKDVEKSKQLVKTISGGHLPDNIVSPRGSQAATYALDSIWIEQVAWRFLGSILVVPHDMVGPFSVACNRILEKLMQQGRITWEINVWASVESRYMRPFVTYNASHDESLLMFPLQIDPRENGDTNVIG